MNLVKDDATKILKSIQQKIVASLYDSIRRDTTLLTNKIKNDKLSNNVLNVRSGKLRNSIRNTVTQSGNNVIGLVYSDSKYANVHEFGFNGTETVKSHLRNISKVYGKPVATHEILISSFTRNMKIKESSFMRSALKEMEGSIVKNIDIAIKRDLNE